MHLASASWVCSLAPRSVCSGRTGPCHAAAVTMRPEGGRPRARLVPSLAVIEGLLYRRLAQHVSTRSIEPCTNNKDYEQGEPGFLAMSAGAEHHRPQQGSARLGLACGSGDGEGTRAQVEGGLCECAESSESPPRVASAASPATPQSACTHSKRAASTWILSTTSEACSSDCEAGRSSRRSSSHHATDSTTECTDGESPAPPRQQRHARARSGPGEASLPA